MKAALLFGLCAIAVAVEACTPTAPGDEAARFAGCRGYATQQRAQRAWERAGRPGGADRDHDGQICEQLAATVRARRGSCRRVDRVVLVRISARRYPATADHIRDAIAAGRPRLLHLDRAGADANRAQSLAGIPTRRGYDRDEYPPAASREGGTGADIRYVPSADNRGAGSILGDRLEPYCNGQPFRLRPTALGTVGA